MKMSYLVLAAMAMPAMAYAEPTKPKAEAKVEAKAEAPIQVMVLGAYHFGNPGRDVHNMKVDDVTVPKRQAELRDVAARLLRFKPTKMAVEAMVNAPDFVYPKYRAFKPADLTTVRDETVQVGFRVAHDAGLRDVYAIDEQSDTVDYFPYGNVQAYVERGTAEDKARFAAANQRVADAVAAQTELQKTATTTELLAAHNDPAKLRNIDAIHYMLLGLGDAKAQPAAELNAAWFLRNAKIFTKLMKIAKPGDRIIVLFGAGHAPWLRYLVEHTPGFQLVEPNDYLRDAAKR